MKDFDKRFKVAVEAVPTSKHVKNMRTFAKALEEDGGDIEACALNEAADRMNRLEAENVLFVKELEKYRKDVRGV